MDDRASAAPTPVNMASDDTFRVQVPSRTVEAIYWLTDSEGKRLIVNYDDPYYGIYPSCRIALDTIGKYLTHQFDNGGNPITGLVCIKKGYKLKSER